MNSKLLKTILVGMSLCSLGIFSQTAYTMNNIVQIQPTVGLNNIGSTCYMNACLQCWSNVAATSNQVLNMSINNQLNKNTQPLSWAFGRLLQKIYRPNKNNTPPYSPKKFRETLRKMNPLFEQDTANDAKDLLLYFLEQMHTELNQYNGNSKNLVMPDNMNPTNKQEVLGCFVKEFCEKYKSIFSHEFYGSNISTTKCLGCMIEKYNYQCYSFLVFPLLEALKNRTIHIFRDFINKYYYNNQYLLSQLNNFEQQYNRCCNDVQCTNTINRFMIQNPAMRHEEIIKRMQEPLNILDAFNQNEKTEYFTGQNMMYCNICQKEKDAIMQTKIATLPNTLVIILNRGKGNKDYRGQFYFPMELDLSRYAEYNDGTNDYYLSGAITHFGESGEGGHFIAYIRASQDNDAWYKCNDAIISHVNDPTEIITSGSPYILFYTKKNRSADNNSNNKITIDTHTNEIQKSIANNMQKYYKGIVTLNYENFPQAVDYDNQNTRQSWKVSFEAYPINYTNDLLAETIRFIKLNCDINFNPNLYQLYENMWTDVLNYWYKNDKGVYNRVYDITQNLFSKYKINVQAPNLFSQYNIKAKAPMEIKNSEAE
ncbi:MAG: ubiquitin carboxyl-terminal hydrolase, partial [Alphaproteobacteria bacterium]|nr:ubiquitin carboxyl-terminal hydrolase [Alphaproteobacteria bacterium]